MKRLLKLLILITIVQLSYLESWSQNNIPSTGGLKDSLVLIPISQLRVANAKMIELKYAKDVISKQETIIKNDYIVIKDLNNKYKYQIDKTKLYKRQRNLARFTTIGAFGLFILSLFVK